MGKVQSKRSVDITTEQPTKDDATQEGVGKLEKIDDKCFKENESSVSLAHRARTRKWLYKKFYLFVSDE